ncbi:MAG: non-canonical purine NTP pyrophosphatase [Hyalangium sp.]|uniref:non-canonical purine NTP pyrophosphatase n=1 Tax=Hyalangium sp. TaxID=2028555 RepID=UPI00389A697C
MMSDWYFNTSNDSKIREVLHVFGGSGRLGILRHPIVELLETDLDKVVRAKAAAAYEALRVPVIVEHGALCIDFMNGLPGALVKPTWMALGERLCHIVPAGEPRTCKAMSALCYCDGRTRTVIRREIEGEIALCQKGSGGFHWDPVFIPRGHTRTLAEMPLDEKLTLSASGQAYAELRKQLKL